MLKHERSQMIVEMLRRQGSATVEEISRALFVSAPTVRRDLAELQKAGLLARTHGGALNLGQGNPVIPIDMRNSIHLQEKLKLDRAAAKLVHNGDVIFIDASSTVLHLVDYLKSYESLLVITNSIQAALLLQKNSIPAYCLGGKLIEHSLALAGQYAENMLRSFNIDWMFFSSSGIHPNGWIVDYNEPETALRRVALRQSAKKVFLGDHTKFGVRSVHNLIPLREVDYVLTDAPLPTEYELGAAKSIVVG